ncbi:RTA1 domain-containing protein KNAG_0G00690 [Huiozyma naganishii CBS 8797]|uniref:Uncharacterized protein n=1 Tax=Huiozyma naganishii (strain ATCC MYA-139 / BCRC 22969 / CBS 8797 / KCTC 17520 / NBRC 10181 / NCYC 3082 / Yp74L-3) TaxID=1071383 RepID=J7R8D1_HUIN7|nr:hypothetical protein KNAG_0G00690 [Kazachstania naganishii CBS 8797]CCK71125.1 hypothetical protein KNAG_0G00690 [Kazachstania naganishii CBS 8797]
MGDYDFYSYNSNKGAAVAFVVLFALLSFALIAAVIVYSRRSKAVCDVWDSSSRGNYEQVRKYPIGKLVGAYIPLLVGGLVELAGYIGRAASAWNQDKMGPYIVQTVLLLIAPTLYAATIYMLFGRLAHLLFAEKIMIMPARWNTLIFVLGDVASLLMQAAGGGMMAGEDSRKAGSDIVTVGLFVQIAFFGLFIINEFIFYFKVYKIESDIPRRTNTWRALNLTLLVNSFLILIRSIVRAIEFIEGYSGYIEGHEWFLYVFDALQMFLLLVSFLITMPLNNIFKIQEESVVAQLHLANTRAGVVVKEEDSDDIFDDGNELKPEV